MIFLRSILWMSFIVQIEGYISLQRESDYLALFFREETGNGVCVLCFFAIMISRTECIVWT